MRIRPDDIIVGFICAITLMLMAMVLHVYAGGY